MPVLKSAVKVGLARIVRGLDQLDVGLLMGEWCRVVARQLAKSRVASMENSQLVLEHPIFRGRSAGLQCISMCPRKGFSVIKM